MGNTITGGILDKQTCESCPCPETHLVLKHILEVDLLLRFHGTNPCLHSNTEFTQMLLSTASIDTQCRSNYEAKYNIKKNNPDYIPVH